MKQIKYVFAFTTVLFGVAVMLFFALAYPHHLHYQEQYQLFLFNWNYVCEVLVEGGLADLAGRFLTQFFLYAWMGASVIACLMMGIQLLAFRVMRMWRPCDRIAGNGMLAYLLSFVPALLCVCFLTDENALMTMPVALLMVLALAQIVRPADESTKSKAQTTNAVQSSLACSLYSVVSGKARTILAVCAMVYVLSFQHYYRTEDVSLVWTLMPWVVPVLVLLSWLSKGFQIKTQNLKPKTQIVVYLVFWAALMIAGGLVVNKLQSQQKEDTMAYDFMARNAMWNRIIQRAQKRAPKNQVSVVALNLALSQRGMLTEQMFNFPQNGMAGLLPNYNKDSFSPLVTAEVFYRLGLINTAQRFVFEAQEAIPDFQKSARCYKRLAETNLINGQYEVARKYLNALRQTLYYRSWAEETLGLLSDEAVEAHPVYGELRRMRCHEDYFFGGNTPQQILIKQLEANPDNRMAEEYLKAAMAFNRFK